MFCIAKRTIQKQSAEIYWSGLDSITDHRNTDLSQTNETKQLTKEQNDDDFLCGAIWLE